MMRLSRATKGSVITEFSIAATAFIFVMIFVLEFGSELVLRQTIERAVGKAGTEYALSRDADAAEAKAREIVLAPFRSCLAPLDIKIFDSFATFQAGAGRAPAGNFTDNLAKLARVEMDCDWTRRSPLSRMILGPVANIRSVAIVEISS